ncbi:hypothetical protein [Occallatibacter savannae]|uniref:hypothetical protein n=1 Tax=Occallatibacter savannae TaxID=1002691 RepID=UPI000D693A50|nr:hypothetical protein [Occallatibacter savannae]
MIPKFRSQFNEKYVPEAYGRLLGLLAEHCGGPVQFRVAETPIFVPKAMLDEMAGLGGAMAKQLMEDAEYLAGAGRAIPAGFDVAGQTAHPHFLTADFALIRNSTGELAPRLVEIQAFPSVFAYQVELCAAYRKVFGLPESLKVYLGGLSEETYWDLLRRTVLGDRDPEHVVLTEVDPLHQKTFPDFELTRRRLGISVVDISSLEPQGNKLFYRDAAGKRIPIERIYNRAIADELISRGIELPFDLAQEWEVEWAGHPNWYFLISKYSIPFLSQSRGFPEVPPACFLDGFLAGPGEDFLRSRGVDLGTGSEAERGYESLLLKPLFSFAGKGIEFSPTRARLEAITQEERKNYILQERMHFEPTIETPFGRTQAEIRILYLWPDGGELTPAISLVRLGRGKMMGVDHNKNQEWVGGSAAFYV